ncbi:Uncharacterised protein [uncultured archaeon]|nr:Uncharacterised protein [uncultured archaeon]
MVVKNGSFVSTVESPDMVIDDGVVNFAITRLLKGLYGVSYKDIEREMGLLECVKQEVYRRLAAPYEDTKIKENGDVF